MVLLNKNLDACWADAGSTYRDADQQNLLSHEKKRLQTELQTLFFFTATGFVLLC